MSLCPFCQRPVDHNGPCKPRMATPTFLTDQESALIRELADWHWKYSKNGPHTSGTAAEHRAWSTKLHNLIKIQ